MQGTNTRKSLFRWLHFFNIILDNLLIQESDADRLRWWSEDELPSLVTRGEWLRPKEWDGTFAWIIPDHPRAPLNIPHAFISFEGVVVHSPQVRELLEAHSYAETIQYLPLPLVEYKTERELGLYYVANLLVVHRCLTEVNVLEGADELIVNREISMPPIFRLQKGKDVTVYSFVIMWQEVMELLVSSQLIDADCFLPVEIIVRPR